MAEIESYPDITIGLEPDGSLLIPAEVMRDIVLKTSGCELWYNVKTFSLGVKLLRHEKFPPVSIARSPGEGKKGLRGIIDAGNFLKRVGFQLLPSLKKLSFRYFKNHQLLEIQQKTKMRNYLIRLQIFWTITRVSMIESFFKSRQPA